MEIGLIFALLAAVGFALGTVFLRRGTFETGESFSAVLITIFTGTLLFSFWMLFTAEWSKIWSLSWQGFVLLGAGGITHFVAGRLLGYSSIRLIGANKAIAIMRTNLFYAVTFGILFLNEPVTIYLIVGVLCIAGGAILVSIEKEKELSQSQSKGVLIGLGGAFFFGISGVLVKPAIEEIGSPYAAVFISYGAALLAIAGLLLRKEQREQLLQLHHASVIPLVISGILLAIAQLLRYIALGYSPVSVVNPLLSTVVLFVFLFSFLINRNIEVFTWKIFTGIVITVVGAFLLFQ